VRMRQDGRLNGHAAEIFLLAISFLLLFNCSSAAQEPLQVVVQGLERDEEARDNVLAALTPPEAMVQDGRVNTLWLERFTDQAEERARRALEPFGYYDARINAALEQPAENTYILRIGIRPGNRVTLTEVNVNLAGPGAGERDLRDLASSFPLRRGDPLIHERYERAKAALATKAIELGYLDATFTLHEIRVLRAESRAGIFLTLDTGPKYMFGRTEFQETSPFPESFLRRYITYREGDAFSYASLGETQINLINSERFNEVIVTPEKEKVHDLQVPVQIRLTPAPTRRLRLGLGYGTDTGARLSLRYRDLNMLRRGHELSSEIDLSERLQGLGGSYKIPARRNVDSFTEIKLNHRIEDVEPYTNRLTSFEVNRTRSFGRGRSAALYLRVQHERFTIGEQDTSTFIVLPGIRLADFRYSDAVRPERGYRYSVDLRGTHQILGSDTGLIQLIADGGNILPLPGGFLLLTRLRAGFTLQNEPLEAVPVSLRFFAGGDRSVRGYAYQSLGPEDDSGNVTGGKHILAGSLELERPLSGNWGAAVFYDAGNAFNSFSHIRLFQGVGIGARYYSRVGAIKVDVARRIGVENPGFRLHFTVGAEF
jgi:translocation and assembly module TamA